MAIELNRAIPLGRNLVEYTAMFGLTKQDLKSRGANEYMKK